MKNNDFTQWQENIKSIKIEDLNDIIRTKIERQKRPKLFMTYKPYLVGVLSTILIFTLLVNLSPEFYVFAASNKIIAPIAELVKIANRNDIQSAFDSDYAQEVNQKLSIDGHDLDIAYVISDIYTVNLFYKYTLNGEETSKQPSLVLQDQNGNELSHTSQFHYYEGYVWIEFELDNPNNFQPLTLAIHSNHQDVIKVVKTVIPNSSMRAFELIDKNIDKSFTVNGQTIIVDKLEIGAFQSRLSLHTDPKITKTMGDIQLKLTYRNVEADIISNGSVNGGYTIQFAVGQLQQPGRIDIQITSASFISNEKTNIELNLETHKVTGLPDFLSIKETRFEDSYLYIDFMNKHGNYMSFSVLNNTVMYSSSHDPIKPELTTLILKTTDFANPIVEIDLFEAEKIYLDNAKFSVKVE